MGLLGASIYMLINLKKQGVPLQGTIIRLVIMAAINVIPTSAGVDYTAHLCGLVVGFILALIFVRKDEQNRRERMNSGTGSFDIYR